MRPRTLVVGNVDPASIFLDGIEYPVLDEIGAAGEISTALQHAAAFRRGVIVTGDKGTGKTLALARAVRVFREQEALRARNDLTLPERRVEVVPQFKGSTRSEVIRHLYQREFGELTMRDIRNGEEALLKELVLSWVESGVAVVVFDEAEFLEDAALGVCRDLLSYSVGAGDGLLGDGGRSVRRVGLGVALIGTPALAGRLKKTGEWGERWTRELRIPRVERESLPDVYASFLPAFAREAERRGLEEWASFVGETAGVHFNGSLRFVETHVDCYLALYADNSLKPPRTLAEVEFDEAIFLGAMDDIAGLMKEDTAA